MDAIININKRFLCDYSINASIGGSYWDTRMKNAGTGGTLNSVPNVFDRDNIYLPGNTGAPYWHEQTQSVFASVELGWKNFLYLTVTGRNDWNSTLSSMSQMNFFYPSAGISGVVSDMIKMPKAISYFKVRGSFADVGGGTIPHISELTYTTTGGPQTYAPVTHMPIGQLYPERTRTLETGFNARFFNNVLRLDATYYKTNSFNQTLNVPISAASGYSSMYTQTGNVQNQGVELSLGAQPSWKGFRWEPTVIASYNENKIIDLGKSVQPDGTVTTHEHFTRMNASSLQIRLTNGGSMGDLWSLTDLETDLNGNILADKNGNITTTTKIMKIGTILPSWKLGFSNSFSWKGVNLNALVSARLGGQVFSRTQAILDSYGVSKASADLRDAGGKWVNNGYVSAETWYKTVGGKQGIYKFYVYDADNVRLQEVSLGYALPSKWFKDVMKMHVSLVGRNLLMIYNKAPFDPEASASVHDHYQGIDYFMQPSMRNLGFSVKIDF